jgi:hypothetical protein
MNRAPLAAALLAAAACSTPAADRPAAVLNDPSRPTAERAEALAELRRLDGEEAERAFRAVGPTLRQEASRGTGLHLGEEEAPLCAEALLWLAERGEEDVRFYLELYLDRQTARRKPLPERVRSASARGLGRFPKSAGAGDVLWAALRDPREAPPVRSACLESLKAFHPEDLRDRVLGLPAASDPWLAALQDRLR